jgi:hypothetical protein
MKSIGISRTLVFAVLFGFSAWGCSSTSNGGGGSGGNTNPPPGSGGSGSGGSAGASGSGGASTTTPSGGTTGSGGESASGGNSTTSDSGGRQGTGGSRSRTGGSTPPGTSSGGRSGRGGSSAGTGGASAGATGTTSSGGAGAGGAVDGGGTTPGDGCVVGAWPTADPSKAGPYKTITENEVGPEAGEADADTGVVPRFTMFRPDNMAEVELCHPVITWGNGTGSTPNLYGTLLRHFASHGFVVIGSNSKNVARGDPQPMLVGVTWVLEQNEDPSSVLYHRLDTTHIGATGHSQGAMATTKASGDSHITTSIPIEGANVQRNLHGPAMFFCGGNDTIVGCSGAQSALNAVTDLPAMYAELIAVDHGSWMSRGTTMSAADTAFTAWMRVHLMGDTELRSWFYGDSCKLCTDSAWNIDRKNMDQ